MFFDRFGRLVAINPNLIGATDTSRFKSDIYVAPWCRVSVYLIGILTGYKLFTTQCKIKIPKVLELFLL